MNTDPDAQAEVARNVLKFALRQAANFVRDSASLSRQRWGIDFGGHWIGALHDGFRLQYPDESTVSVLSRARDNSGPTSSWSRREYLFDVVVAEAECRDAPFRTTKVPVIRRSIWQVESEVVRNARGVAEDLGKLVLGSATSSLMIAAVPLAQARLPGWVRFIEGAAAPIANNFYLALLPTYSAQNGRHQVWLDGTAGLRFYRRLAGRLVEDEKLILP